MKHGDVILEVDGRKDPQQPRADRLHLGAAAGRDGRARVVAQRQEDQEAGDPGRAAAATASFAEMAEEEERGESGEIEWLGIEYQELTPQLRSTHSHSRQKFRGVWITSVAPEQPVCMTRTCAPTTSSARSTASRSTRASEFEMRRSKRCLRAGFLRLYAKRGYDLAHGGNSASFFAIVGCRSP